MRDLSTLQTERNAWVAENFPDSPTPQTSILGCMEEVGEIVHHWLKRDQNIRGSKEEHDAEIRDGLGDLVVYLAGVATYTGADMEESWQEALAELAERPPITRGYHALRRLFRAVAKMDDDEPSMFDPQDILVEATSFARTENIDLHEVAMQTWEKVRQRNWIEHPDDGGEKPDHEPTEQPDHA